MPPDKLLSGIRVLLTRALDTDDEPRRLLVERGAKVWTVPLIRIGPPPNERELRDAADRAHEYAWITFASRHGVGAFARIRNDLPHPPKLAAVGPASADAVTKAFGRPPDLVPDHYDGEHLGETLRRSAAPSGRILLIQADDARPTLANTLRAGGFAVDAIAAYSTIEEPPRDIADVVRGSDVIMLASGSAVRSLVKGLGGAHAPAATRGKLIACIGAVTESEAKRAGLHVEVVPEESTFAAMIDAIARYFIDP